MEENNQKSEKRRSTLRVKDLNYNYSSNNSNKRIKWNISESKPTSSKKSYPKDPKTPYISYVYIY